MPYRSLQRSGTPARKNREQHRVLALAMLMFADLGVQGVDVVEKRRVLAAAFQDPIYNDRCF